MKKKIIILISSVPNNHIKKKFSIGKKFNNFEIIFWNYLPLINEKVFNEYEASKKKLKNHVFIKSLNQNISLIKKLKGKFFYSNLTGAYIFPSIADRFLYFKGGKKFDIDFGPFIDLNFGASIILRFLKLIKNVGLMFVFKKVLFIILGRVKKILSTLLQSSPVAVFTSCEKTKSLYKKKVNQSKIFKINSEDFSKYLKIKKNKQKKYITFLDQGFDDNFDYAIRSFKNSKFNVNNYWYKMNKLFVELKNTFPKNKIIIAAHPRRRVKSLKKYTTQETKFDLTAKLISQSKLVVTHYSQALNLAVLFNKPIILIDSMSFDLHTFERSQSIMNFSRLLNLKVLNIDIDYKLYKKNVTKIDKTKYENYKNLYLRFAENKNKNINIWNEITKKLNEKNI